TFRAKLAEIIFEWPATKRSVLCRLPLHLVQSLCNSQQTRDCAPYRGAQSFELTMQLSCPPTAGCEGKSNCHFGCHIISMGRDGVVTRYADVNGHDPGVNSVSEYCGKHAK